LAATVDRAVGARARLLAVYDYLESWFAEDSFRGCSFINAFGELGPSSPVVAEYAREHKRSFQQYLAGLAADADAYPRVPRRPPPSRARPHLRRTLAGPPRS